MQTFMVRWDHCAGTLSCTHQGSTDRSWRWSGYWQKTLQVKLENYIGEAATLDPLNLNLGLLLTNNTSAKIAACFNGLQEFKNHKRKSINWRKLSVQIANLLSYYSSSLKIHKLNKAFDGIRYPCDQCDYVANIGSLSLNHIASVHEGIKYPWWMWLYCFPKVALKYTRKPSNSAFNSIVMNVIMWPTMSLGLKCHKSNKQGIRYPWGMWFRCYIAWLVLSFMLK